MRFSVASRALGACRLCRPLGDLRVMNSLCALLVAVIFFLTSSETSRAAIYRYTVTTSGPGSPTSSIELILSGLTVTGVGPGTGMFSGASLTAYVLSLATYADSPTLASISGPYFKTTGNERLALRAGSTVYSMLNGSIQVYNTTGANSGGNPVVTVQGLHTVISQSLTPAPAPLPGAGWLSWLLVAGAALPRPRRCPARAGCRGCWWRARRCIESARTPSPSSRRVTAS